VSFEFICSHSTLQLQQDYRNSCAKREK